MPSMVTLPVNLAEAAIVRRSVKYFPNRQLGMFNLQSNESHIQTPGDEGFDLI